MGAAQSGPKITAQDRAILSMKAQRDKLREYRKKIQVVLDQEQRIAKEALQQGNKERALTALRRRKFQESLLQKTDGQLEVLTNLVSNIEFALIEKDVMFGLEQGNKVLKQIHSEMDIEKVQKLMDDTAEGIRYQREIDEMLMSTMSVEEEEAVQQELAQLQAEALPAVPEVPQSEPVKLPEVHETEPASPTAVEERQPETSQRVALPA
ncbi:Vacuolar protein sorting-associated protein 20 [Tulasnella sp. 424]|nr:Vacuolar protein sorting-associated protein 20 [Tulasnella sp. 424]KAG8963336.1 Vacuolar protein sorting-associated protein 20 [Tulasnella sp. 425]